MPLASSSAAISRSEAALFRNRFSSEDSSRARRSAICPLINALARVPAAATDGRLPRSPPRKFLTIADT